MNLDPRLSGVHGCRCPLPGGSGLENPAAASLPARLAPRRLDGYGHSSSDLRTSSPSLSALLFAVAPPPRGLLHRLPYFVHFKASPFCQIQCSWIRRRCHLRWQVQPANPPSDMVAPISVGFLILVSRYGGYGIAQPQAREKSLLGLPGVVELSRQMS